MGVSQRPRLFISSLLIYCGQSFLTADYLACVHIIAYTSVLYKRAAVAIGNPIGAESRALSFLLSDLLRNRNEIDAPIVNGWNYLRAAKCGGGAFAALTVDARMHLENDCRGCATEIQYT